MALKWRKITAIFNGKDGSLGFVFGREYTLSIEYSLGRSGIRVRRVDDLEKTCTYDSIGAFLDNWKYVTKAEEDDTRKK